LGAAARSLVAATRALTLTDGTVPLSRHFDREMAADISALHEINGVQLICDATIESYYSGEGVVGGLRLADGRYLPADVVLVGVGAIRNTEWPAGSGIGLRDGVLCDPMGRTHAPGVVAVGDCAAWLDEESGKHWRLEHWAGAVERPAIAVASLLEPGAADPAVHSFRAVYFGDVIPAT
jgi:NADPH-dependent 2,4-dienoyl-CoA reductase/sulfur reductase-like enzyme